MLFNENEKKNFTTALAENVSSDFVLKKTSFVLFCARKKIKWREQGKMYHQICINEKESFSCVILCLVKDFSRKRKKIFYSMERLAVRAVNESKAGIGKIRSYQKKFLEREKNSLFNREIGAKSSK